MSARIGATRRHPCGCVSQYAFWDRTAPNTAIWDRRVMCDRHANPEYRERIAEEGAS